MKVVLINTFERNGGAAIAANRLMKALINSGIDAKTLVLNKQTNDENVISIASSFLTKNLARFYFFWERWIIFLHNRMNRNNLFTVSIANTGFDISTHPLLKDADIIHIHWINQGFLSLAAIDRLVKTGKPIVWTIHDMWTCTGICHHARECDHFIKECGQCFFLQSKKNKDLSFKIFMMKRQTVFFNNSIVFVACSNWLSNKAKISGLSKNNKILSIPNPIDINTFKIIDQSAARKKTGLPENKKLLLFGAANVTDKRKGIHYFMNALEELQNRDLYSALGLVIFGQAKPELLNKIKIPVYIMGYLRNQDEIVALYNAVDLYVTPSLEDNLPNTIMEAMACGTPCVGFDVGGIPEMINHKHNGYVAEYKNVQDLAEGINWVLNESNMDELSMNARKKVESTYSEKLVAKQYIELYESIFQKN